MLIKKKLLIYILLISILPIIGTQDGSNETQSDNEEVTRSHKIRFKKDVIAEKDLQVRGRFKANKKAKFKEDVEFEDEVKIEDDLTVEGTLFANNVSIGSLDVGSISIGSLITNSISVCDLTVGCNLFLEAGASLSITGDEIIGGTLSVGGDLSVSGNESIGGNVFVTGDENINGTLSVGGDLSVSGMGSFGDSLIAGCDLSVGCNIDMVNSTDAAHGNINKAGVPFIHNYPTNAAFNTFLGLDSGNFTMTGVQNTGVGTATLFANTTGNNNVAVGYNALASNTTGVNNIAVGMGAGNGISTTNNNILIGNLGLIADAGTIRIGANGTHTSAFIQGIYLTILPALPLPLAVFVGADGQLGTAISSRRYKENIEEINKKELLERFARIIPVMFSYKNDPMQTRTYGMIAEELEKVMPELVAKDKDGNPASIAYHLFTPLLIAMIQQLQERVEKLEKAEIA